MQRQHTKAKQKNSITNRRNVTSDPGKKNLLENLPDEVVLHIFRFSDAHSFFSLARTGRRYFHISNDDLLAVYKANAKQDILSKTHKAYLKKLENSLASINDMIDEMSNQDWNSNTKLRSNIRIEFIKLCSLIEEAGKRNVIGLDAFLTEFNQQRANIEDSCNLRVQRSNACSRKQ